MEKLRLDYFLMRGGLLDVGDVYGHVAGGEFVVVNDADADEVNSYQGDEEDYIVKSFTQRGNLGDKPISDGFPIEWEHVNGGVFHSQCVHWDCDIKSWRPDIEKLLEQQAEYDEQLKPIEELILNTKESVMQKHKQGDEVAIAYNDALGGGRKVVTGTYQIETDKEICILDENGIFDVIDKVWFIEYALTDKQEMEAAIKTRNDTMFFIFGHYFKGEGEAKDAIRLMGEDGFLKDIILPLRG